MPITKIHGSQIRENTIVNDNIENKTIQEISLADNIISNNHIKQINSDKIYTTLTEFNNKRLNEILLELKNNSSNIDKDNLVVSNLTVQQSSSIKNLTVEENLIVKGTSTSVESTDLKIKDNLIELNKDEIGNGVSLQTSGISINRGLLDNALIIFDERDDLFKIGIGEDLKIISTREWVESYISSVKIDSNNIIENDNKQFISKIEKDKLNAINENAEENQNAYSNIKVDNKLIQSNSKTDTFSILSGENINIEVNELEKQITINSTGSKNEIVNGSSNFSGFESYTEILLPYTASNTNFCVSITPTQNPNFELGELWVEKFIDKIRVYNSGSFNGTFDYSIFNLMRGV